jgi:excisionase family DNA binding protein
VDPASVTQALKEACSIVDEILPLEEFGRGKSAADRTQLRSVSLPLVFAALLGPEPGDPLGRPDDDDWVSSGQAAEMLNLSSGTVATYAARGLLKGIRTPGGRWRFRKGDVRRFNPSGHPDEGVLDVTGQDIIQMRDDRNLSWAVIAAGTGWSVTSCKNMYRGARAAQALGRLEEFTAASDAAGGASPRNSRTAREERNASR